LPLVYESQARRAAEAAEVLEDFRPKSWLRDASAIAVFPRRNRIHARRLTARQEKFLRLITTLPIPSIARAAKLAGYSESVAMKPKIICESPSVRPFAKIRGSYFRSHEFIFELAHSQKGKAETRLY
jgi:hypothetical protein